MGTVLSSFNFPGLVPLQVGCGVSLKVHSQVALELKEPSDVLSSIEQLPLEFKILLFVAVHIVAGSIMGVMDSSLQYLKTFWTTLRCFVGQTDWNVESTRNRVLWWHFNVFAFVAIYGYVLNVMSTDTFVMKQPRRIERFEDAFDPYFKKVRFYMMKNSFFFNTMRDADENTIMGKVFKKLNQTSDCSQLSTCSFLEINGQLGSTNHQETLQLLRNVSERGGGANFMANELVENFVIPGMCRTQPDMIDKVYTAPKALAEDILVNFMREDVDRNVVVYLRHIFASVFESGYFWVSMQESIHSTLDVMGSLDRDFNYLSCCMRRQPESNDVIIQSGPIVYRRLVVVTGSLILAALFFALAERSTSKRLKRRRRKKLKSDVALVGTVLSSFNFPGLVPLQVGSTLSLKVHSQVSPELKEQSDVLSSIEQLPLEFKILLFVAAHIAAGSIIGVNDSSLQYLKTFWTTLRCFVGQTDWNVESTRKRVLWWHFNVFAFVAIYGYVLNVMSTDTFVMKQPRRIERFEDALDPYFKKVRFYLLKNAYFFNTMRDSKENTIMGKVFRKMKETSDCSQLSTCSFMELDGHVGSTNQQESLLLARNLSERGGGATFMANELIENFVRPAMCRMQPDMIGKLYTAPQALAEEILVNFMREDIDRDLVVYMTHMLQSGFEFGCFWLFMQGTVHSSLDALGSLDRDFNYMNCYMRRQPESDDVIIQSGPRVYKRLFTLQPIASISVGYETHPGKYSSFLGQLIENKSDVAIVGTVLSSFNFPGLVPLQVGSALLLKVHSQVAPEIPEPSHVLSSIEKLPLEFKILLVVAIHMIAGSIISFKKDSSLQYLKTYWTTLRCFVGQTDFNVKSTRKRVLWWHFNVFAFVSIYGYVLNVMSTDTFVMKQPKLIERFDDAFDPYFKKVRFYMMKNSLFFNAMRDSKENTIMGKVFKKMNETSDCSQLSTCSFLEINGDLGSTNHQETLQLMRNVSERGGGASFMANELVENFVVPGLCRTQPDMIDKLYTAPQALAEDIMVNFMRDDLDRDVVVYIRHIFASVFEAGYLWVSLQENIHIALDAIGSLDRDFKYLNCYMRRQPESDDVIIQSGP
ncbi:hypothetical protein HDE_09553 [Halotydeus destructor]|nr:hypothetical protein HDE_09553 [Halotydeus destructor]